MVSLQRTYIGSRRGRSRNGRKSPNGSIYKPLLAAESSAALRDQLIADWD
jgi:hypothetical protein